MKHPCTKRETGSFLTLFLVPLAVLFFGCATDGKVTDASSGFSDERRVVIIGYDSDAMEPFVTKDGRYLLFNSAADRGAKDLLYAEFIDDATCIFRGEIAGANTAAVEATPSLDGAGEFFFMSTRELDTTGRTLFRGEFSGGAVENVRTVFGTANMTEPFWINMGVSVNESGDTLLISNAKFTSEGVFDFAGNIRLAVRHADSFDLSPESEIVLGSINTSDAAQYAAELSSDGLEIFYSEVRAGSPPIFRLCHAARATTASPFGQPLCIGEPFVDDGFAVVEAPSLSGDGRYLYYHKRVDGRFSIFRLVRE